MAKKDLKTEVNRDFTELQKEFDMIAQDKLLKSENGSEIEISKPQIVSESKPFNKMDTQFQEILNTIIAHNPNTDISDLFKVIDLMLDEKNVDKLTEINFPFKHSIVKLHSDYLYSKKMIKTAKLEEKLLFIDHLYMQSKERKSREEFVKMKTSDIPEQQMNPFSNFFGANQPNESKVRKKF
jgi:hypothetical protein